MDDKPSRTEDPGPPAPQSEPSLPAPHDAPAPREAIAALAVQVQTLAAQLAVLTQAVQAQQVQISGIASALRGPPAPQSEPSLPAPHDVLPPPAAKEPLATPPEPDAYTAMAAQIKDTVLRRLRKQITPHQEAAWAARLRRWAGLVEKGPDKIARMQRALDWWTAHYGEPYVPVIESAESFVKKITAVESAIARAAEDAARTSRYRPGDVRAHTLNAVPPRQSVYALAKSRFSSLDNAHWFEQHTLVQAKPVFPRAARYDLYAALLDLRDMVNEHRRKFSMELQQQLPGGIAVVDDYLTWLEDQTWIEDKTLRLLNPDSKVFAQFCRELARRDVLRRHPLTGESLD